MTRQPENDAAVHPSIAGFVAAVRQLESQLSLPEDPAQYVGILESQAQVREGAKLAKR
jgi:hypothetical protein